jgi:putative flippase GtrA
MLVRAARYFVVGGISACVDIGFFFVFAKLLGFNYLAVATIGFLIAVPVNYLLSVRFVFRSGARFKPLQELALVYLVSSIGLGMHLMVLYAAIELGLELMLSKLWPRPACSCGTSWRGTTSCSGLGRIRCPGYRRCRLHRLELRPVDACGDGRAIVNLDKLTYAGNERNLASIRGDVRHTFVRGDICDRALIAELLKRHRPRGSSISPPKAMSTARSAARRRSWRRMWWAPCLLEESRGYWEAEGERAISVSGTPQPTRYGGSLGTSDPAFTEQTAYAPNSSTLPQRRHRTISCAPTITPTACRRSPPTAQQLRSHQLPEKLIPLMIHQALAGKPLPVYGDGKNVRDGSTSAITATPFAGAGEGAGRDLQHRR